MRECSFSQTSLCRLSECMAYKTSENDSLSILNEEEAPKYPQLVSGGLYLANVDTLLLRNILEYDYSIQTLFQLFLCGDKLLNYKLKHCGLDKLLIAYDKTGKQSHKVLPVVALLPALSSVYVVGGGQICAEFARAVTLLPRNLDVLVIRAKSAMEIWNEIGPPLNSSLTTSQGVTPAFTSSDEPHFPRLMRLCLECPPRTVHRSFKHATPTLTDLEVPFESSDNINWLISAGFPLLQRLVVDSCPTDLASMQFLETLECRVVPHGDVTFPPVLKHFRINQGKLQDHIIEALPELTLESLWAQTESDFCTETLLRFPRLKSLGRIKLSSSRLNIFPSTLTNMDIHVDEETEKSLVLGKNIEFLEKTRLNLESGGIKYEPTSNWPRCLSKVSFSFRHSNHLSDRLLSAIIEYIPAYAHATVDGRASLSKISSIDRLPLLGKTSKLCDGEVASYLTNMAIQTYKSVWKPIEAVTSTIDLSEQWPGFAQHCLPPKLTKLDLILCILPEFIFYTLPTSLSTLRLGTFRRPDEILLAKDFNSGSVPSSAVIQWPTSLTSLSIETLGERSQNIKILPSSLKILEIRMQLSYSTDSIRALPQNLTSLGISTFSLEEEAIRSLPPSLKRFNNAWTSFGIKEFLALPNHIEEVLVREELNLPQWILDRTKAIRKTRKEFVPIWPGC